MVLTVTCKKCNRKTPTNEVRLQADKTYLCFACAGYNAAGKDSGNTPFRSTATTTPVAAAQKVRYQCQKCHYTFSLKEGHAKKCPYCNSERLEERTGAAQKLIDMHVNFRES